MCCDPRFWSEKEAQEATVGVCPDCGSPVDDEGEAVEQCYYSPTCCKTCNWSPCDGSC